MPHLIDLGVVSAVLQLIVLECILSIDNAAVMGAMVAHLPDDQPTPWPTRLNRIGGRMDRLLGPQRAAALKVGLFGAYAGRVLMVLLASIIIRVDWIQMLGALYLLHLGLQHFVGLYRRGQIMGFQEDGAALALPQRGFWGVVVALNMADMAFSLDNVVAAVTLSDRLWVVMLGAGIGIAVMRFAATLFTRLLAWEPRLENGAYLLLLAIGSELLLDKLWGVRTDDVSKLLLSVTMMVLAIAFARVQRIRPLLQVFRPGLATLALVETGAAFTLAGIRAAVASAARDQTQGVVTKPRRGRDRGEDACSAGDNRFSRFLYAEEADHD